MNPIKIAYSLISPQTVLELVTLYYSISSPQECSLLCAGDNDNYLIKTNAANYVLRIYRKDKYWLKTKADYLFEMDWLNYLHQNSCHVAHPLKLNNGEWLGEISAPEGSRYFALFTFAEGVDSPLTGKRAFLLGKELAKIHLASNSYQTEFTRVNLDLNFLLDEPVSLIRERLGTHKDKEQKKLLSLAKGLKEKMVLCSLTKDAWGIIAGDVHGFNQHFQDDHSVILFDFDLCGYGWRAYDLAVFRWLQVSDLDMANTYVQALIKGRLSLWRQFLAGYQSLRKLSKSEVLSIPLFVQIRQIWLMGSYLASPNHHTIIDDNWWDLNFKRLFNSFQ